MADDLEGIESIKAPIIRLLDVEIGYKIT